MRMKLTAEALRSLGPIPDGKPQRIIRDTDQPGFFAVQSRKTISFSVQADHFVDGKRVSRRVSLGRWPEMTPAEARRLAGAKLAEIKKGEHQPRPTAEPRAAIPTTLAEAFDLYRTRQITKGRAASTLEATDRIRRILTEWRWTRPDGLSEPVINAPLAELASKHGRAEMKALHKRISDSGKRASADTVMRLLRAAYNVAADLDDDLPVRPPTRGVDWNERALQAEVIEHREAHGLKLDQLAEWNRQRLALPNPIRQEFHLWSLLSGMRRRALASARWDDLLHRKADDGFESHWLKVLHPKGGVLRRFELPLSTPMVESLDRLRVLGDQMAVAHPERAEAMQPWIFPSPTAEKGHVAEAKEFATINGEKVRVLSHVGHALRHCWRNAAEEAEVPTRLSRKILNHSGSDVHDDLYGGGERKPLIRAQEKVSAVILREMGIASASESEGEQ